MDNLINLAKKGYEAYEAHNHSGGDGDGVQDRRHHEAQAMPHLDHDEIVNRAQDHTGDAGDRSHFLSAISHVANQHSGEHIQPIDEHHVTNSHKEAYEKGNGGGLDAGSMGAAAAMQAFKMFTSGGGVGKTAGGDGTSQLISLAMGEASKLFAKCGGSASGGKQEVINGAAMTMMKLVVQSKLGGGIMGGGHSSGLGSLMGLAKQLL